MRDPYFFDNVDRCFGKSGANRDILPETIMILSPAVLDLVDFKRLENHVLDSLFFPYLMDILETVNHYRSKEEAEEIIRHLFESDRLKTILETGEAFPVNLLCRTLPSGLFRPYVPLLKERIIAWKENVLSSTVQLLCKVAPEEFVDLLKQQFESGQGYWTIPVVLLNALEHLPEETATPLIRQYLALTNGDTVRYITGAEITQIVHTWKFGLPEREGSFLNILDKSQEQGQAVRLHIKLFFDSLYGAKNPISYLHFQHDHHELSAECVELIRFMLVPETPVQELIDVLTSADWNVFQSSLDTLINSVRGSFAKELLREAKEYSEKVTDIDCFQQIIIAIGSIAIEDFLDEEIDFEGVAVEKMFDFLTIPWAPLPCFQQLADKIEELPKEQVLEQLEKRVPDCLENSLQNLANLMEKLAWPELIPLALDILNRESIEPVRNSVMKSLIKMGEPALSEFRSKWEAFTANQKIHLSSIIAETGGDKAIDFLIATHDDEDRPVNLWSEEILVCSDQRFLPLLEQKIADNENSMQLEDSYYKISVLLNQSSELLTDIRQRHEETEKEKENSALNITRMLNPEPRVLWLNLEMVCQNCGYEAKYHARHVIVNDKQVDSLPMLGHDIPCAECNELNEFDLTEKGVETIQQELERIKEMNEQQVDLFSPLKLVKHEGEEQNTGEGQSYNPLREARENVRETPEKPVVWLIYGNLCYNLGQVEKSIECYRKCLSLNPNAVEATFGLAKVESECGNDDESLRLLREQWENWDQMKSYFVQGDESRFRFFRDYAQLHNEIREKIGANVSELKNPFRSSASQLMDSNAMTMDHSFHRKTEPSKTAANAGRNDPCPCGSGKKFKKCCLH